MTFEKNVAGIIPGVMALGVLGESAKMLPKKGKKTTSKDLIGGFVPIIAGTAMIKPVANMVSVL